MMEQVIAEDILHEPWKTESLRPETQAVLPFLKKLTIEPEAVTAEDTQALRAAGLTDDAIRDAIAVCGAFNVIDRLADAFGFDAPAPENLRDEVRFLVKAGYKL